MVNTDAALQWVKHMQDLQRGETHLSSMLSICKQVKEIVRGRQTTPSALINRTESLINELNVTERKDEVVQRFKQDYQLDESAAQTITSGDIDEPFFQALQRVHLVHENCRSLLHTHHQRAGLELLDSMASYEETAYERLCKYARPTPLQRCDHADLKWHSTPALCDSGGFRRSAKASGSWRLRRCTRCSAGRFRRCWRGQCCCGTAPRRSPQPGTPPCSRPFSWRSPTGDPRGGLGPWRCMHTTLGSPHAALSQAESRCAESRCAVQFGSLQNSASGSCMAGCRRYVGDMLAWIHQAVASENELLASLVATPDAAAPGVGDKADAISSPELLDKVRSAWFCAQPGAISACSAWRALHPARDARSASASALIRC